MADVHIPPIAHSTSNSYLISLPPTPPTQFQTDKTIAILKMVNENRQFFVGGNFKMNGSVKSVSDLIKGMNEAKLDGKTG